MKHSMLPERAGIQLLSTREEEWQTIKYVSEVTNPLHYPSMYQDMSKIDQQKSITLMDIFMI